MRALIDTNILADLLFGRDPYIILSALDNEDFSDFEDCLQEKCAVAVSADYIVSRNLKDFVSSRVPAILPK